jgi:hypothetical protein
MLAEAWGKAASRTPARDRAVARGRVRPVASIDEAHAAGDGAADLSAPAPGLTGPAVGPWYERAHLEGLDLVSALEFARFHTVGQWMPWHGGRASAHKRQFPSRRQPRRLGHARRWLMRWAQRA